MSAEAVDNPQQASVSLKPSDVVSLEIAKSGEVSEMPVPDWLLSKTSEELLLRLQKVEAYMGREAEAVRASLERDEDEKKQLQLVKQQELRKLVAETDKLVQDNTSRRKFSWAIFTVMVLWMMMVLFVVIFCATGRWRLSDSVLIALITTTTATVIGVFVVVANYLFNREKST